MLDWYDIHMIILYSYSVAKESAHVQLSLYDDMHNLWFYEICDEKHSSIKKQKFEFAL